MVAVVGRHGLDLVEPQGVGGALRAGLRGGRKRRDGGERGRGGGHRRSRFLLRGCLRTDDLRAGVYGRHNMPPAARRSNTAPAAGN